MKKMLNFEKKETWYFVDGKRITGIHDNIWGNVSGITGNVTGITGDLSGITGNVSGIRADVTGIRGDVTDISGDVDACEITSDERKKGIDIKDLIK